MQGVGSQLTVNFSQLGQKIDGLSQFTPPQLDTFVSTRASAASLDAFRSEFENVIAAPGGVSGNINLLGQKIDTVAQFALPQLGAMIGSRASQDDVRQVLAAVQALPQGRAGSGGKSHAGAAGRVECVDRGRDRRLARHAASRADRAGAGARRSHRDVLSAVGQRRPARKRRALLGNLVAASGPDPQERICWLKATPSSRAGNSAARKNGI